MYTQQEIPRIHAFRARALERDVRARIAHARVLDIHALAALLVPHPPEPERAPLLALEHRQRAEQDADRVPPADGVLRALEVLREVLVRLHGRRRREREQLHRLVVERAYRRVDREPGERRGRRRRAREAHGRRRARRPLGVVERVREAGAPAIRVGLVRARREQQRRRTHQ